MNIKDLKVNRNDIIIISGCGRSGTKSCAEYLGGHHEPRTEDWAMELEMFKQTKKGRAYAKEVARRIMGESPPYIEVNSAIAGIIQDIQRELPDAKIYHLKRNKEDVIKSILKRENYTPESEPRNSPEPEGGFSENFTRKDKIEWMVDQYYKFMADFPIIETESIPIIRNQS